ncbi:MAG: carboxypeptidase-like regulatory domain-containing protein [Acidobacteriota bacterium]|nr:carboxypeptidase-like regulatory domain-containing protein [Acidobacteriota bacterium]
MTLSRICAASLLIAASPLLAADTKPHAAAPTAKVTISGVVRDAATGAPIAGAIVHSGSFYSNRNGTAADGKYTLALPGGRSTTLIVEDFAYDPVNVSVVPVNDAVLDLRLTTSRPTVTVKLKNGETHVLDLGTSQFGYFIIFSGYGRTDNGNFCKPDGSQFLPDKTEISKIIGPATLADSPACCTRGQVMFVTVELKSGERTQAFFNDSCFGNEVDFIGRERSTGQYLYLRFTDIAELDFQ